MSRLSEVRPHCSGVETSKAGGPETAAMNEDPLRIVQDSCLEAWRKPRVEIGLFCVARIRLAVRCAGMRHVMEHDSCITSIILFSRNSLIGPRHDSSAAGMHTALPRPRANRRLLSLSTWIDQADCRRESALEVRWAIRLPIVSIELLGQLSFTRFLKQRTLAGVCGGTR